jgi:hypothetical protein
MNRLNPNQRLRENQPLTSSNGRAYLVLQSDGNLVVYQTNPKRALWASKTRRTPNEHYSVIMQHDGNLVILNRAGGPVWATGSQGHPGAYLIMQDDGNAVIYQNSRPYWASGTQGFGQDRSVTESSGFFENVVKAAGSLAGSAIHAVSAVTEAIDKGIASIPVIGGPLHMAYTAAGYIPFLGPAGIVTGVASLIKNSDKILKIADDIASGKRLDRVAMGALKREAADIKETGQFAQMVVSFVPGVGPGISGALAAGVALANGQRIDQAMVEAVKGAIPGGPIAKAAFAMGEAAIQGKRVDDVVLSGLPIPPDAKKAISTGIHVAERLAKGERLDKVALDEAKKLLPSDARRAVEVAEQLGNGRKVADILLTQGTAALGVEAKKAMVIGMGLGYGEKLQKTMADKVGHPQFLNQLKQAGSVVTKADPLLNSGKKLLEKGRGLTGYDTAAALMRHRVTPSELLAVRNKLSPADKKGFDLVAALHVGRVTSTRPRVLPKGGELGYFVTKGMMGASPARKDALIKIITKDPANRASSVLAFRQVAKARKMHHAAAH